MKHAGASNLQGSETIKNILDGIYSNLRRHYNIEEGVYFKLGDKLAESISSMISELPDYKSMPREASLGIIDAVTICIKSHYPNQPRPETISDMRPRGLEKLGLGLLRRPLDHAVAKATGGSQILMVNTDVDQKPGGREFFSDKERKVTGNLELAIKGAHARSAGMTTPLLGG